MQNQSRLRRFASWKSWRRLVGAACNPKTMADRLALPILYEVSGAVPYSCRDWSNISNSSLICPVGSGSRSR